MDGGLNLLYKELTNFHILSIILVLGRSNLIFVKRTNFKVYLAFKYTAVASLFSAITLLKANSMFSSNETNYNTYRFELILINLIE